MRVSPAALALLVGSATAFVPTLPKSALIKLKERQKEHQLSSQHDVVDTPSYPAVSASSQEPSSQLLKLETIQEAWRCLSEIEGAAEKAREYLAYLNQVAMVVRAYLEDQSTPLRANFEMRELQNVQEAREYLVNIEKATASAQEYLVHLEEVAADLRSNLQEMERQMEMGIPVDEKRLQQAQEAQLYLEDLEETARSAKEYLAYLKSVTDVVQQYLVDPNLQAEGKLPSVPPLGTVAKKPTPKVTSTTPIEGISPPRAPALEVDTTTGPTPVKRIDAETGGSYLESLRSSATTAPPPKSVTLGSLSYLDSLVSASSITGAGQSSYLDSIAGAPSLGSPTSHFQKSFADSTPYSEAGPPAKGRSDVSHMDQMEEKTSVPKIDTPSGFTGYLDQMAPPPKPSAPMKAAPSTGSYLDQMSGAAAAAPPSVSAPTKAAPSTGSYLDQMSGAAAATSPSVSAPKKAAPSTGSYLDQMSGAAAATPPSVSALKKAAPSTGSYLDQMSGAAAATPPSVSAPKKAAPSTGSYLDQMSGAAAATPPSAPKKAAPSSYLDQMSSAPPPTSVPKAAAPATGSYLDQMSGAAAAKSAPPKKAAASTGSYLDQMSSTSKPIDWSKATPGASSSETAVPRSSAYLDQLVTSAQAGKPVDVGDATKEVFRQVGPDMPVNWSNPASRTLSFPKKTQGTGSMLQTLEPDFGSVHTKSFAVEEKTQKFFSDKLERKEGEPIPPQFPILGSKYMAMLKEAADKNPTKLIDELEKRRVVRADIDREGFASTTRSSQTVKAPQSVKEQTPHISVDLQLPLI